MLGALGLAAARARAGQGGAGSGRCTAPRACGCAGLPHPLPRPRRPRQQPAATAAPAPTPNKGDVAWMLTSTALVLMMSVPALALFYGGHGALEEHAVGADAGVRRVLADHRCCGASTATASRSPRATRYFGSFDRLFLKGTFDSSKGEFAMAATFSKNTPIPELVYVAFQATFAAITVCLDPGRLRRSASKFSAVLAVLGAVVHVLVRCRSRTWSGSGPARTRTRRPTSSTRRTRKAGFDLADGARSTSRAARSCTSTPASPGSWARYVMGKRIGFGKEVDGARTTCR